MKTILVRACATLSIAYFCLLGCCKLFASEKFQRPPLANTPTVEALRQIQSDFLQIQWPIQTRLRTTVMDIESQGPETYYRLELLGEAKAFQDAYPPALIAWALRPYLSDSNHDAEAALILTAVVLPIVDDGWSPRRPTTFRSRDEPGDWEQVRKAQVDSLDSIAGGFASDGVKNGLSARPLKKYRVPPDQVLPSSLKKNEENSLASSATSVATTTPQATPSQTPTPQGAGTVERPKPTPSATAAKTETEPQATPTAQTESQKQTWPLWLAAVAAVLGALGIVAYRSRKQ